MSYLVIVGLFTGAGFKIAPAEAEDVEERLKKGVVIRVTSSVWTATAWFIFCTVFAEFVSNLAKDSPNNERGNVYASCDEASEICRCRLSHDGRISLFKSDLSAGTDEVVDISW